MSILQAGLRIGTSLVGFEYSVALIPFYPVSMTINGATVVTGKKTPTGSNFSSFLYDKNNIIEFTDSKFEFRLDGSDVLSGFSDLTILETIRLLQSKIPIPLITPYFTKFVKLEDFTFKQESSEALITNMRFQEIQLITQFQTIQGTGYISPVQGSIPIDEEISLEAGTNG